MYRFVFLADMQLGAYATFSGLTPEEVHRYASELGMRVAAVPAVEGWEWDARQYEGAVSAVNAIRPDLVVIGGDMIDDPSSEDQYDEFMRITASIDADIPVRWVPGNHDIAPDALVPTPDGLSSYRRRFGDDYYAFDHGPLRFVALNTVVIDHPEQVPGEWEAQREFLAQELRDAETRDRPSILIGHHPLFLREAGESDDYWNLPLERRRVILDLIHRHRVPMALAGHWHRNSVASDGRFEMITSGPVGYPLGADPSGFRVFEVDAQRITHRYESLDT
jgi:3',5'-cyclic AMP phosphodiesterase CpdA